MRGSGAAASAHYVDAVLGDEFLVVLGEFLRREGIMRMSADVLRQPGVRQHGDFLGRVVSEVTHRIIHLFRASGAVEADNLAVVRFERSFGSADLGAQQHGAGGFEGNLRLDRQAFSSLLHSVKDGGQRNLGLQNVLRSLDEQHVAAALDQAQCLVKIGLPHSVKANVAERWQLGGGTDRAGDEARLIRGGEIGGYFAGDLCGSLVDLVDFILEVEFAQDDAGAAEGIGFHNIGTRLEIRGVNVFDDVRPAENQHFRTVLFAPKIVERGLALLNLGAHGAVVNNDTFANGFEKGFHSVESRPTVQRVPAA